MAGLTPARRAALEQVVAGKVGYSLAFGSFEPEEGHRSPAFGWLEEEGYIAPEYEATPEGRVTQRVPVRVTEKAREELGLRTFKVTTALTSYETYEVLAVDADAARAAVASDEARAYLPSAGAGEGDDLEIIDVKEVSGGSA